MVADPILDSLADSNEDRGEDDDSDNDSQPSQPLQPSQTAKPTKQSLGDCLVTAMGSVADAMVEMAKITASKPAQSDGISGLLSKIDRRLDEQTEINKGILEALRSMHQ